METRRITNDPEKPLRVGYLIHTGRPQAPALELGEFFTLGRDPGNHLVVDDPFVSGRHARIERKTHGYIVRDQHSRNGTRLNGSRVTEATLAINDRLQIGETVFVFSEVPTSLPALTSRNSVWNTQLQRLPAFAATDFPVLITGSSGTGKEVLAQWIHKHSSRQNGPFIGINCSALSENLIESELFGHTKGSFTGAMFDRKGAFEAARGGTLFLDEIGDLPLALQPKLLRALENREIRPVGSDRTIETDVRIVAATHKNPSQQIQSGEFREDLYYRLNVCHIRPPDLKERMDDFDDLIYSFAKVMRVRFSFHAIQKLKEHSWPGNIRELKNAVARAAAYYPGVHIQPEHCTQLVDPVSVIPSSLEIGGDPNRSGSVIKEIEREMIIRRLIANRGNQRRTAEDLGIPKSTLHDRIRSYEIDLNQLTRSTEGL